MIIGDLNKLNLLYGFTPPNEVYVTEDNKKPVENTLVFNITNPSHSSVVTFVNQLGEVDPGSLPTIDEMPQDRNISLFYVYFPYADYDTKDRGSFCSEADAKNITLSSDSKWWDVGNGKPRYSPVYGYYWTIYPRKETILNANEGIAFNLGEIVTQAVPGMTYMGVESRCVPGYDDDMQAIPIYKKSRELQIQYFRANPSTVAKGGKSTLSWEVVGADFCTLDPGDYDVDLISSRQVITNSTMNYTLSAQKGDRQVYREVTVYVVPPAIQSFTAKVNGADLQGPVEYGTEITLEWDVLFAAAVSLDPGIGTVESRGTRTVAAVNDTIYTLTCTGEGEPVKKTIEIKVSPVAIKNFSVNSSTVNTGQTAVLSWQTAHANGAAAKIYEAKVIAGVVDWSPATETYRVPDAQLLQGTLTVNPEVTKHYKLVCQGPNGEVVSSELALSVTGCVNILEFRAEYHPDVVYASYFQLHWNTENAANCEVHVGGFSSQQTNGVSGKLQANEYNMGVYEPIDYTATITCSGPGGNLQKTITFHD
jgi:hypothetical protein